MRLLLNIIWFVVSGLWFAILYTVAGVIACIFIVTIPFGIASFRIAAYAIWPFGREVVRRSDAGTMSTIGNVIWFVFAGLWIAIGHIVSGVALCISIIGIPLAIAHFKLVPVSLMPLGSEIVDSQ